MEIQREKRVAKNSLILYIRLFVTMAISLYTSRVILNVLGVNDFGIFSVVAGFISMFSVLSDSLSTSISRFITIALGKNDIDLQKKIFSNSVNVQVIITILVVVLVEIIGLWFINEKINVPKEREGILNIVFQLSVANFAIGIIKVAFTALIFAHEKATVFAWLTIIEAVLKLFAVLMLSHSSVDRLVTYVLYLLIIHIFMALVAAIYCFLKFNECRYKFEFDSKLLKEIFNFSGWSLIGRSALIISGQGINMLMNVFFGVIVNAARGIASQVDGATQQFVNNMMIAVNPQIIKAYAAGDFSYMNRLVCKGAKFAGYVALLYTIPLLLETEQILHLWLGEVPEYAVAFTRLSLLSTLFYMMTLSLNTAIQATGEIKKFQLITSILLFSNIPITYILFTVGLHSIWGYIVSIIINISLVFSAVFLVKNKIGLSGMFFIKEVPLKIIIVMVLSSVIPLIIVLIYKPSLIRLLVVLFMSILCTISMIFTIGTTKPEKNFFKENFISKVLKHR